MNFTVADCMKLPSLREAKLVAGTGGLGKVVLSVSVLEHAKVSVLSKDLMCANELIVSAFVMVKDNVDEQLALVSHLCSAGISGIILYYVGIVLPQVDKRLIQLADKLNFPIICMPENRYELRYGEVIGEVYEAIIENKIQSTSFVNLMLKRIAQLEEHKHTFDTVLWMLSTHLSCSLLLTDYTFNLLALATCPIGAACDLQKIVQHYREMQATERKDWETLILPDGFTVSVCRIAIALDKDSWINLIVICEPNNRCPASDLLQAADLLRLFTTIWKKDIGNENMNMLIQAIIEDEPIELQLMLQRLRLDISDISIMWVIRGDFGDMPTEQDQSCKSHILSRASDFLKNRRKPVITGIYKGNVVIMMTPYSYLELDTGLAEEFAADLLSIDPTITITTSPPNNRNTVGGLRESYLLFNNYYVSMRKIYPHRSVYTSQEVQFAKLCHQSSMQGKSTVFKCCEPVTLLRELKAGGSLVETLATYLLDNQSNLQKTGEQLFVHISTIKYRLKKIQLHLGYNISEMPASLNLYIALGVDRLCNGDGKERELSSYVPVK